MKTLALILALIPLPAFAETSAPTIPVPFTAEEMNAITGAFCDAAKYGNRIMADQVCAVFAARFEAAKKAAATASETPAPDASSHQPRQ